MASKSPRLPDAVSHLLAHGYGSIELSAALTAIESVFQVKPTPAEQDNPAAFLERVRQLMNPGDAVTLTVRHNRIELATIVRSH